MIQKEGRDWLELSESVFYIDDNKFCISDTGATIYLTAEDIKLIVKFITKLKEKNNG